MALSFKKITAQDNVEYYNSLEAHEERYYAGNQAESGGHWLPSPFRGKSPKSARRLGGGQAVNFDDLRQLCAGFDPELARRFDDSKVSPKTRRKIAGLTQNAGATGRVKAFDLCCSAPKDISVLWALADPEQRIRLEHCQQVAVETAARYVNEHLIAAPCGQGGKKIEIGVVPMAAFPHFTSRSGDPNLHTHVVVPNVCQRPDNTYGVIESAKLLRWQGVIEGIYHAELARLLAETFSLPIAVIDGEKAFHVDNASEAFIAATEVFSKRRQQVIKAAGGQDAVRRLSHAAEARAVLRDRQKKTIEAADDARRRWHDEAKQCELTTEEAHSYLAARGRPLLPLDDDEQAALLDELKTELTSKESTFTEARFLGRLLFKLQGRAATTHILDLGRRWLARLVRIGESDNGEAIYSTAEMIALERQMLADALYLVPEHSLPRPLVEAQIRAQQTDERRAEQRAMTDEQADAVRHVLYSPRTCAIYSGAAGSGKSFSGAVIKTCLEQAGYSVIGLALSWKAAEVMRQESGIANARAIAGFLKELREGKLTLTSRSVVVIDEAGLVDSRSMAAILAAVRRAGGKLILTGDTRQLMPVAAGGAMAMLAAELGEARIDTVRRQKAVWQREAGTNLVLGRTTEAVAAYAQGDCFRIIKDRDATLKALVADWAAHRKASPDQSAVVIGVTRRDVADLNEHLRAKARQEGWITGNDVSVTTTDGRSTADTDLAIGDRVQFRKNLKDQHIFNRHVGTIEAVDHDDHGVLTIRIRLDDGRLHTCRADPDDPCYDAKNDAIAIEPAWAMTCYSAQGQTKQRAFVLHDERMDRRLAYVAMTRHTDAVAVYVDRQAAHAQWAAKCPQGSWKPASRLQESEVLSVVTRSWSRETSKLTTCDYGRSADTPDQSLLRWQRLRDEEREAIKQQRARCRAEVNSVCARRPIDEPSIDIARKGNPHLLFVEDAGTGKVEVERRNAEGKNWRVVCVDSASDPRLDAPWISSCLSDPDCRIEYHSNLPASVQGMLFDARRAAGADLPVEFNDALRYHKP